MNRPMKFLILAGEPSSKPAESQPKAATRADPFGPLTFAGGGCANVQVQLSRADTISAGWMVPYAMPPSSAWTGSRYEDGRWTLAVYISIDGMLLTGTISTVTVSNGQLSHGAAVYIGWNGTNSQVQNFPPGFIVNPLDTITCSLCSLNPTSGIASFMNVTTGTPFTMSFDAGGSTSNGQLNNEFGNWGVYDEKSYAPFMPQFTAVSFFDCLVSNGTTEAGVGTSAQNDFTEYGQVVAKVLLTGDESFLVYSTEPNI